MVGAKSLDPLADSPVEYLTIVAGRRAPDLSLLPRLEQLQTLELTAEIETVDLGDWSMSPIEAVELRDLHLGPKALDGLVTAPRLKKLSINASQAAALARFRSARPEVDLVIWGPGGPNDVARTGGPVEVRRLGGGWQILDDVADLLACPTNYDAEDRVRESLDAATAAVVEFDSEAGAFAAYSDDRPAIDTVAAQIATLACDASEPTGLPDPASIRIEPDPPVDYG